MKNYLLILIFIWSHVTGFSQELSYDIRGYADRKVNREALLQAGLLSDFIAGYPKSWIKDYISVEVLVTNRDQVLKATGANNNLNAEQKDILKKAEMGSEIVVEVNYKDRNAVTNDIQSRSMIAKLTVVPVVEAIFPGGNDEVRAYLKETIINKLAQKMYLPTPEASVQFIVNASGEVTNVRMTKSSGNAKTDKLMIDAIKKMPKWKPAENSWGAKVEQQFEFKIGERGC